jgi:hypothetical protein
MISTDGGHTWNVLSSIGGGRYGLAYDEIHGSWIASGGRNDVLYSYDTVTWNGSGGIPLSSDSSWGNSAISACGGLTFVTLGYSPGSGTYVGSVYMSNDGGVNFNYAFGTGWGSQSRSAYSPAGIWLAGAGTPYYSTDGVNFNASNPGIGSVQSMTFGANTFVVGDSGGNISTTPDAISWTPIMGIMGSSVNSLFCG